VQLIDDTAAEPVLTVLPPALVLRNGPGTPWLPLSTRLLVAEVSDPSPGAAVMISRILDLLFIHALRAWARADTGRTPGWLTGATTCTTNVLAVATASIRRGYGLILRLERWANDNWIHQRADAEGRATRL